jgi:hypothetical protein
MSRESRPLQHVEATTFNNVWFDDADAEMKDKGLNISAKMHNMYALSQDNTILKIIKYSSICYQTFSHSQCKH